MRFSELSREVGEVEGDPENEGEVEEVGEFGKDASGAVEGDVSGE
jgi:hypothetical protein